MLKTFNFYFLFINLFFSIKSLKCDENDIDNCSKCGEGIFSDTCAQCEPKSFSLFNGLGCFKCDDPEYGQRGCKGDCDSSLYDNGLDNVLCKECKEGYFNEDGFCFQCSIGSDYCTNCIYDKSERDQNKKFKCLDCLGGLNGEYRVRDDGKCHKCSIPYCLECKYTPGTNDQECVKCIDNYYIDQSLTCSQCTRINNIANGNCYHCPQESIPNSDKQNCRCNSYYVLKDSITCTYCGSHCYQCKYIKDKDKTECIDCDEGFYINNEKTCSDCGGNCAKCHLDSHKNLICEKCKTGLVLIDNICYSCPPNCENCQNKMNSNNKPICNYCKSYYELDKNNNVCLKCPNNCPKCHLNAQNKLICDSCDYNYVRNKEEICEYCNYN